MNRGVVILLGMTFVVLTLLLWLTLEIKRDMSAVREGAALPATP